MIDVLFVSAAAQGIAEACSPPAYTAFAESIGTSRFTIRVLDGGDSIFFPESIEDSTGTFEIDHCVFNGPAIIFRQGEYTVPESPHMSLDEAKRRISHFTAGWDDYERISAGDSGLL